MLFYALIGLCVFVIFIAKFGIRVISLPYRLYQLIISNGIGENKAALFVFIVMIIGAILGILVL